MIISRCRRDDVAGARRKRRVTRNARTTPAGRSPLVINNLGANIQHAGGSRPGPPFSSKRVESSRAGEARMNGSTSMSPFQSKTRQCDQGGAGEVKGF